MPRRSQRYFRLKQLQQKIDKNTRNARLRLLLDMEDDFSDHVDIITRLQYNKEIKQRYLFRGKTYKKLRTTRESSMRQMVSGNKFSDAEFLEHFRMQRCTFCVLKERIFKGESFKQVKGKGSAELHLMAFLKQRKRGIAF